MKRIPWLWSCWLFVPCILAGANVGAADTGPCCEVDLRFQSNNSKRNPASVTTGECRICPYRFSVGLAANLHDLGEMWDECKTLCDIYVSPGTVCPSLGIYKSTREKLGDEAFCVRQNETVRLSNLLCEEIRNCRSMASRISDLLAQAIADENAETPPDLEVMKRLQGIRDYTSDCLNNHPLEVDAACKQAIAGEPGNPKATASTTPWPDPEEAASPDPTFSPSPEPTEATVPDPEGTPGPLETPWPEAEPTGVSEPVETFEQSEYDPGDITAEPGEAPFEAEPADEPTLGPEQTILPSISGADRNQPNENPVSESLVQNDS